MSPDEPGAVSQVLVIGPFAVEVSATEPWAHVLPDLLAGFRPGSQSRPAHRLALALGLARRSHHGLPKHASLRRDEARWVDRNEMWDASIERAPDGLVQARFELCDDPPVGEVSRSAVRRALVTAAMKVTFAHVAPWCGGLLLHASALVRGDGRGLVFCGPSGEGKTTMPARLPDWRALSDDAALLFRDADAIWRVAGTPLAGREGHPRRAEDAPLAGLVHLDKGAESLTLETLGPGDALGALLARIFYFAPPDDAVLSAAAALVQAVPSHRLRSSLAHDPEPLLMRVGA